MIEGRVESFGAVLRRRRELAGLSQEQLAERAGLSGNAIGSLERGDRRRPYPHTIQALADALGLAGAARAELLAAARPQAAIARVDDSPTAPPLLAKTALPAIPTPLIGREADTAAVAALLREGARLVTLTGPGGVGKTRLAVAVAEGAASGFPDGVIFVPLASLSDPALVVPTVARALGLRVSEDRPLRDALQAALGARHLLVVLDNCEHLLDAAPAIADLVAACPGLAVLATSRAALHVRGEQEWAVGPLALPAPERAPAANEVAAAPAVQLFLAQARATMPAFALTPDNAAVVAAICRRLDGLPLALELAAGWVKLLSPAALLGRLDRALPLLTGGARDLPARQRTLRDTVAWSYDLLEPHEQRLFRQLAPFVGGWTLDAAEVVGGDTALADLAALVNHSLVQPEATVLHDEDAPRYTMLETIRAYAAEQLAAAGEDTTVREGHARYYVALAEQARLELFFAEQGAWLHRLDHELDNIRAALAWLLEHGHAEHAVSIGWGLEQFWVVRGHLREGQRWMEQALAHEHALDTIGRARARYIIAYLAHGGGHLDRAAALYAEAVNLARAAGDRETLAFVLANQGFTAAVRQDFALAEASITESIALFRDLGPRYRAGQTQAGLALVALGRGDIARAEAILRECEAVLRETGMWWHLIVCLNIQIQLALGREDHARAAALCREGLAAARRIGDSTALIYCLVGLAGALVLAGETARAARLFGAAEALCERTGMAIEIAARRMLQERHVALARARLDAATFATAWAAGRDMTLDEAVAEALATA